MSEEYKIALPKLGESIVSATIVQWFKKVGDTVQLDEPLLEVSTDKVNSEIPSPVAGILTEILAQPDQELSVGEALAIVVKSGSSSAQKSVEMPAQKRVEESSTSTEMQGFFSPALLRLAAEKGISLDVLQKLPGTGEGGRITKRDLESYAEKKSCPAAAAAKQACAPTPPSGEVEHLKMSGMRKAIADNMVRSFYEAPHATLVTQVDVTDVLKLIQKEKESFQAKHGAKLTLTAFVARAIAKALQEYPLINSSLEKDTIVVKHFVNLGIAVSIDQGLMVPVIKQSQKMEIPELAKAIGDLSAAARSGKLAPDSGAGGTITLTNFGMTGVQIGIPIIRYPEVAIVGIGAACKQVVPLEDDLLAVRSLMYVSLTFDHRVLDGIYGCGFLSALKKQIETNLSL
ncbi:MAG: 2-oxo acid dehydrogenase subunit E2 [Chlamydiales bacterium]|nr:2-oxo acid dehydrogenase subunit E2 [Chlamydiales bacterium]